MPKTNNSSSSVERQNWVILITGISLCFVGIIMLLANIKADGNIDFKFFQVSGKITSPNAGLFIFFFGIVLIAITKVSIKISKK